MRDLFRMLSVFDWVTPVANTVEDIKQFKEHGVGFPIFVNERQLEKAEQVLRNAGIKNWSAERYAFHKSASLTIPTEDMEEALWALHKAGIEFRSD